MNPETAPVPRPQTFAVATFGCKVNQYESQVLRERLVAAGLAEVRAEEAPDLLLVNTCTVTGRAGAESRRYARRAAGRSSASVVVTGCHADSAPGDFEDAGIALVAGNEAKGDLLARLGLAEPDGSAEPFSEAVISGSGARTRASVKIQDGCRSGCAYCIVPSVRPVLASKGADRAVAEIGGLVAAGFLEVVLTGIHLGYYGRDRDEPDALAALAERILDETALPRLRLSSLEARELTPRLLRCFAAEPDRMAPHVHLPLQSGASSVLRRMGRRHDVSRYREAVAAIRDAVVAPALTTDVIAGFPGETDEEHEETVAFCEEVGFLKMHVFPYSDRPGTRASALPGKVDGRVVRERAARLVAVSDAGGRAYRQRFGGRTVPVLVESRRSRDGHLTGLTDRYVRVDFEGPDSLMNTIAPVRVLAFGAEAVGADRAYGRLET